jgi:hypothetical protein
LLEDAAKLGLVPEGIDVNTILADLGLE